MKKLFLIAIVVIGFSTASFAQAASSTLSTNAASTTIMAPIILENTIPLAFGTVGASAGATTVILAMNGTRGGTATVYDAVGAPATAASFNVTGTPNATFVITLPTGGTQLAGTGVASGAPVMTITDWNIGTTLNPAALDLNGLKTFQLTGTLNVGTAAVQTPGLYTGTYSVTVAYN
jgi:hypothetical protein